MNNSCYIITFVLLEPTNLWTFKYTVCVWIFFKLMVGPEYLGANIALQESELPADASSGHKMLYTKDHTINNNGWAVIKWSKQQS